MTDQAGTQSGMKVMRIMYVLAAAAMAVAGVLALVAGDLLKAVGNFSLVAALILLATARPEETRAKKVVIYALVAVAIGLLIARLVR